MAGYEPVGWKNYPDKTTSVSAENLNHMDEGIKKLDTEKLNIDKITQSTAVNQDGYALDAREKNASISGTMANQISELNTKIVVGDRTVLPSITIAGNSSDAIEYTIDNSYTRNGYVAVGILGVDTRTVGLFARTFEISKLNTVRLVLDNKNTSSIKQSPFVRILYIKG